MPDDQAYLTCNMSEAKINIKTTGNQKDGVYGRNWCMNGNKLLGHFRAIPRSESALVSLAGEKV